MTIYLFASAASVYFIIQFIKLIPYFSGVNQWTFGKEIASVIILLTGAGVSFYFMGFIMEEPVNRWNISTLLDSCKYGFLIGIIPLGFFVLMNFRYLFTEEILQSYADKTGQPLNENKIHIISRLKKEELSFFPHQFIYAESDGNYVIFHLSENQQSCKKLIRNSMNDIERQLSEIKFFIRIHRAFIVNVKKVKSQKGNTLGYKLKLYDTDAEIPVSRQKVRSFDHLIQRFK